ncbi:hypothetical protein Trisim1_001885 [Trichoderma cf. simile WF8]
MDVASCFARVESPSSIAMAISWACLPVEIHHEILSLVGLPWMGRRYKVAKFAAVCREWQAFFETCLFRRLVLDSNSLGEFDAIIKRHDIRLAYIRKLWLRIQLPSYGCSDCDRPENGATQRRNNAAFTMAIQSLLETLTLWDPARHGSKNLALMLSASSRSDAEHRFRRCEIKDTYPFHYAEDLCRAPGIVDFHRANVVSSLTVRFHQYRSPPMHNGHIKRVQGTPLQFEPKRGERGRFVGRYKSLPAVPIVKGLVMRRQFRRDIHTRTLSELLSRSFVALEWFRFEKTIPLEPYKQTTFDRDFQSRVLPSLPRTLHQFSFTQWEIPKDEIQKTYGLEEEEASKISSYAKALPWEMAKLSHNLEQFCPPWQMDTAAFLRSLIELSGCFEMPESSLKRIVLRCSLKNPFKARRDFESLVMLAAKAALSLPRLTVMELWGTCLDKDESRAYIFRYTYEDSRASIVWRSNVGTMTAQSRIITKWNEVAEKNTHSTLIYDAVSLEETEADIFRSNGTCIYRHLLLKDLVFDPITQIILENEPTQWGFNKMGNYSAFADQGDDDMWDGNGADDDLGSEDGFELDVGAEVDDNLALQQTDITAWQQEIIAAHQASMSGNTA